MWAIFWNVLTYPFSFFRPRHDLALEVLALRHQLMVFKRQAGRPKLGRSDRFFWMLLMRVWPNWRNPLMIFQPETLIGWQRFGFKMFWQWKSRRRLGQPGKDAELIQLIRRMWATNPTWGSPRGYRRIVGALNNLGHQVSHQTVANVLKRHGLEPASERQKRPPGRTLSAPSPKSWPPSISSPSKFGRPAV